MWPFICALLSLFFITISTTASNLASLFLKESASFWQEVLDRERSFSSLLPPARHLNQTRKCLGVVKSNQRCQNSIAKNVDWMLSLMRALVETDPNDPSFGPMLRQYVSLWLCRCHRDPNQEFVKGLLKRWEGELRGPFLFGRLSPLFMPRLQGHIIMPGSFLDDGDDVHAVNYDHNDDEMEQAFTFNTFSPLSTPPPQSYPIMPGSFLDDEDDIYADKDEPIQPNGLQEANESFGTGGAVSSPSTPSPTNANNEHRRPSSKRKRPGRGHSQVTLIGHKFPYDPRCLATPRYHPPHINYYCTPST